MQITSFLKILVPITLFLWINPCTAQQSTDIYVSPLGSDSNSGTKDSPYKTLYKATERLGSLTALNQTKIVIWLQDGTYRIRKPITIDHHIK